jgi:uncharacterized protein YoxC
MKIWQEITKKIEKKDLVYWFIILGWTFALVVLGMYLSPESQILNRMGTLVSIILAMVAIFYAIVQGVTSQQNIGAMHSIMDNVNRSSQALETTAQELLYQTGGIQEMQSRMDDHVQRLIATQGQSIEGIPPTFKEVSPEGQFNIDTSYTSPIGLLILYWIAKTFTSPKASSWQLFCQNILGNDEQSYTHGFALGLAAGTNGRIYVNDPKGIMTLREDIPGFEEKVEADIVERIDTFKGEENQELFRKRKQLVDDYFAT